MFTVFYRRFYILLFLIWLGAVSTMFVLSVWGGFDAFVYDFNLAARFESGATLNGTYAVNGSETLLQAAEEESTAVRREVVYEVRKVERKVEQFFTSNDTAPPAPDPIKREIREDLSANRTQAGGAQGETDMGRLENLDFTHTETQFLARLKTTRKVGRITYFHMENPLRLIVDLRGKWRFDVPRKTDFRSGFVERVVLGQHTDRLRLVFHFRNHDAEAKAAPELIRTPQGLDILVPEPPAERDVQ